MVGIIRLGEKMGLEYVNLEVVIISRAFRVRKLDAPSKNWIKVKNSLGTEPQVLHQIKIRKKGRI